MALREVVLACCKPSNHLMIQQFPAAIYLPDVAQAFQPTEDGPHAAAVCTRLLLSALFAHFCFSIPFPRCRGSENGMHAGQSIVLANDFCMPSISDASEQS